MTKLLTFLKTYKSNPEYNQERESGRLSFVQRFPKENLENLRLEEYVVGGEDKDTFSNWLEFKKILFGIGGGNSSKFGIYQKKEDQSFKIGVGTNAKILKGQELSEYFHALKFNLVKAIGLVEQNRIDEIKNLDLPVWNLVLEKILVIYFPEKFINVGSNEVLIACAKDLGMDNINLTKENIVEINYELRKRISTLPEFNDLDYIDIGLVVWEAFKEDVKRDYYIIGTKYGGNQDIFPELLDRSIIATGFAAQLDLSDLVGAKSKDIQKFLEEHGEQKSSNALNLFLNLKPGDRVALKADGSPKGTQPFLSIIAIAEVIDKDGEFYQHEPEGLGHLIPVKFLQAPIYKEYPIGGFGSTLQKVRKDDQINLIFNSEYEILDSTLNSNSKMSKDEKSNEFSLNQILYGPPGTGKTYTTIEKAISIVNPNFVFNKDRNTIKVEYERLVKNGQIVFTTFHQSMSYEDFIEGIKPTTIKEKEEEETSENSVDEPKPIQYEIQDGIFKRLCQKAKGGALVALDFDSLWKNFFDFLMTSENEVVFKSITSEIKHEKEGSTEEVLNVRFKRTTDDPNKEGRRLFHARKNAIKRIFEERIDASDPTINTRQEIEKILSSGRSTIYNAVYNSFFEFHKMGEKFKSKKPTGNFVLIIDEINRGNVSQIFGELITLIEEDKRLGKEEQLEVILPYSKKPFGVPANLHIIGTMNTADRSVEALDAALRRRFTFEEMSPRAELLRPSMMLQRLWVRDQDLAWKDPKWVKSENDFLSLFTAKILDRKKYEALENETIFENLNLKFDKVVNFEGANFEVILKGINKRIEKLLDKDHQIGHSYLINVYSINQLKSAFQNKIIPLLQEYFFGDYGKIGLILGQKFFEVDTDTEVKFKAFDYNDDGLGERKIYRLKDLSKMKNEDFKLAILDLMN
jgi:5-methylcytosine-specific restriction endonuclease McrBC GTP-binding regulatory subunit McrB